MGTESQPRSSQHLITYTSTGGVIAIYQDGVTIVNGNGVHASNIRAQKHDINGGASEFIRHGHVGLEGKMSLTCWIAPCFGGSPSGSGVCSGRPYYLIIPCRHIDIGCGNPTEGEEKENGSGM